MARDLSDSRVIVLRQANSVLEGNVLSEKLKVALVIDEINNQNAGTEGQLLALARSLPRYGVTPTLVVLKNEANFDRKSWEISTVVTGATSLRNPLSWFRVMAVALKLRRSGVELVHTFFNDSSVFVPPVFRSLGIKCLISRRDLGYWYTSGYRAILRFTAKFVAGAIVNSHAVRQVTHKNEKIPLGCIDVIYNGYESVVGDELSVETDLGPFPRGGLVVALVANLRAVKRIDDAINGIAVALAQGFEMNLVVIGDGDASALQELSGRLGIDNRVHFLGRREDVKQCLKSADVGLLCSDSEGFSNSIVEYMFAGLPVVCSNVGGNPEAIEHGVTGFLFEKGDQHTMAEHLARLASDSQLRHSMGEQAQASAKERFSMDAMIQSHVRVYRRVLGNVGQG